jgi:hypothetical protein
MLAMERLGVKVEVYPLLRERATVMHAEAAALVDRAHFQPFLSWAVLRAQGYFLLKRPAAYLAALGALLRGTWGSLRFFAGALAIFPKTVYFARRMAADGVTHVHAHFANHPAAAAFVIRRLVGIPYSFTAHGSPSSFVERASWSPQAFRQATDGAREYPSRSWKRWPAACRLLQAAFQAFRNWCTTKLTAYSSRHAIRPHWPMPSWKFARTLRPQHAAPNQPGNAWKRNSTSIAMLRRWRSFSRVEGLKS